MVSYVYWLLVMILLTTAAQTHSEIHDEANVHSEANVHGETHDEPSVHGETHDEPNVHGETHDEPSVHGETHDEPSVHGETHYEAHMHGKTYKETDETDLHENEEANVQQENYEETFVYNETQYENYDETYNGTFDNYDVFLDLLEKIDLPSKNYLMNFVMQLLCTSDCELLAYNDYGCHCGLGNKDPVKVVDGIDLCCKEHDECYDRISCPTFSLTESYYWDCVDKTTVCLADNPQCLAEQCECDKKLAECFKNYPCPDMQKECGNETVTV